MCTSYNVQVQVQHTKIQMIDVGARLAFNLGRNELDLGTYGIAIAKAARVAASKRILR